MRRLRGLSAGLVLEVSVLSGGSADSGFGSAGFRGIQRDWWSCSFEDSGREQGEFEIDGPSSCALGCEALTAEPHTGTSAQALAELAKSKARAPQAARRRLEWTSR